MHRPIIVGRAAEFDFSGTQAVRALREEEYSVILVNGKRITLRSSSWSGRRRSSDNLGRRCRTVSRIPFHCRTGRLAWRVRCGGLERAAACRYATDGHSTSDRPWCSGLFGAEGGFYLALNAASPEFAFDGEAELQFGGLESGREDAFDPARDHGGHRVEKQTLG